MGGGGGGGTTNSVTCLEKEKLKKFPQIKKIKKAETIKKRFQNLKGKKKNVSKGEKGGCS